MASVARSLVVGGILAIGVAPALAAQHEHVRRGFWIGFGLGYGSAGVSYDGSGDLDRQSSFTSAVRLGGTLKPGLLLGADLSGWTRSQSGTTVTIGHAAATGQWYPSPSKGFFVRGAVGIAVYRESNGGTFEGAGGGLGLGGGYDIRVGRNISLTAQVDVLFGSVGDITSNGTTIETGLKQNVIAAGLGVMFH
jgi:hypothetical protein